jgi:hypothetical protein
MILGPLTTDRTTMADHRILTASRSVPATFLALLFAGASACTRAGDTDDLKNTGAPPGAPGSDATAPSLEFDSRYPVGFSFLNGVRELGDGLVLAADPLSQVLLRIHADMETADTLGRPGPGPQEYRQPDRVFSLPADSSLLVDLGKAQLTTVLPDGSFGSGLAMLLPSDERFGQLLHPRFVDEDGNLYFQAGRSRDGGPPDSAAVIRYGRGDGAIDTVGMVWLPEMNSRRSRSRGFLPKLMEARDDWAVGADGELAIMRAHGHIVEWTRPDGSRTAGSSHTFPNHPVGRSDKEALLVEFQSEAISMMSTSTRSGSVTRMTMSRGVPDAGDRPDVDEFEWAEFFPAFRPDRALIAPSGELWLERWLPVERPTQWEVFDEEGRWVGSVTLPPRYRLLGFGTTTDGSEAAYLSVSDEFDLKWLERHRVVR